MNDKELFRFTIALIGIGVVIFVFLIIKAITIKLTPQETFNDDFYEDYAALNFSKYFDENGNMQNLELLKEKINENYIFNTMLNEYTNIKENYLTQPNAAIFLNVALCANGSEAVLETTEEELNKYSTDEYIARYKIKKSDFDKIAMELMQIDTKDIVIDETYRNYCVYDSEEKMYYILISEDKDYIGNDSSLDMRCLSKIEKNEDVYTLYFDTYEVYNEIMNDLKGFILVAKTGTYQDIYNKILKPTTIRNWTREIVKVKELPNGLYVKYAILDKAENNYLLVDGIENPNFIKVNLVEKLDEKQYKVKLANTYIENLVDGELSGEILEPNTEIILKTQCNYDKFIGQNQEIQFKINKTETILEGTEDTYDWIIELYNNQNQ